MLCLAMRWHSKK